MGHIINPIAMRIGWFSNWVDTFFVKLKYYPEYLHSILRLRNYLFFFVRQERFEGIGLFHSHFVIFQKYNYIYINIFIYDGIFHTKKSELSIEMNNLFNLYKRSPLLKNLLNLTKKAYNPRISSPGLLDDTYYLYQKAAESWTFMQLLLCYCIMTNKSNNAFFNLSFDFITFKKKHPFFNVKLFFKFLKFFNKNKWNAFLRLFRNPLKYKINNDIKFFNNVKFFNNLYNKNSLFDINNDVNLKLTSKKFLITFIFWFKSKLSNSTYNNIKDLNFLDIKFILSNIFPEYFERMNLIKSKAYFTPNSIFQNIFNILLKKSKTQVFLTNFYKKRRQKFKINGFNIIRKLIVFYKYSINYYKLFMHKRKKNTGFRFIKKNFWINFLYYSIFLNKYNLKLKHKHLKPIVKNFSNYSNNLKYIYKKKRIRYLHYSFYKVKPNISYYYNDKNRRYSYLYSSNILLVLYNQLHKLQNISKKIKLNVKWFYFSNYFKTKFLCFKTKKFLNEINFKRQFHLKKFHLNVIYNQFIPFLKRKVYLLRFYSWKKYYYFHKYAYKTVYKSKYFYNNYKLYLRTKSLKLMQNKRTPYYLNYFLIKNNVVLFFFPINYYKKKLLYEQKKAKLLQESKPLTIEEKKLLRNFLRKRQKNFKKILKLILKAYYVKLKKINLLITRKKVNLVFKAIFCWLKFYYNKIYFFIIDSTSFYKSIFNKIKLLKRCCWILECILFSKFFYKMKKLQGKMKKFSFYSVLKNLIFYKKKPNLYAIKKNKNSMEQNKINIFFKFILKMHNLRIIKLSYWNETPKQNLQNVYNYLLKYKHINVNYKNWHKNLNIFMKIIRNRVFISKNFHKNKDLKTNNKLLKKNVKFKTNYKFLKYKNKKFLYQDHAKHDYWYKSSNLRHENDIFFKFNWRFFVLFSILLKKRYSKISKNPTYTENLTLFLISLLLLYKYIIPFFNKLLKFTTLCLIKLIKYYPLKISYLLINNNQVTGRFLSRYIALKLKNGYSVWELLSPIKKDLNYVRSLTARPNFSFFSGYLKSLRDDFHLNKYNSGIFVYLLKFFCFFYNKQASYFYNNVFFSWLNLDLLFFSTSLYNNIFFNKQIKISCSLLYFLRRSYFTLLMKNKNELSYTFKKFVKDSAFLIKSGIFFNNFSNYLYDDFFSSFEVLCIWDLNSNIYVTHKCIFLQNIFFNRYLKHFKYKYSYIDVINYFELNKRNLRSQGWRNNLLGLLGFKISCSGRFSRRDRASHISFIKGKVPLNTLKAKIDYGMFTAPIKNSAICVKVWLNKGFNYVNFEKKISL